MSTENSTTITETTTVESNSNPKAVILNVQNVTDNFAPYGKPNAIVRPVRRYESLNEMVVPPQPADNVAPVVCGQPPPITDGVSGKSVQREIDGFTKELDFKLKNLQKDKKITSKNSSNGLLDQCQNRPRFVTTVPTGIYLQPAKEFPTLHNKLSQRTQTYAYFSIPKIFAQNIAKGNNDCPLTEIRAIQAVNTFGKLNKLREPQTQPQNIMFDKRVVRGSNYSHAQMQAWNPYFAYAGLLSGKGDFDATTKEAEAERRQLLRRRYIGRSKRNVIGSPPPVKGRRHETVQTERYLEELLAKTSDHNAECQTDLYLYPIPAPPYIPTKTGIDVATEISEGDLFDFDAEVEPILDALIDMTMAEALKEVVREEEMAALQKEKEQFLAVKESEIAQMRRLEAEQVALSSDWNQRSDRIGTALDVEINDKVTAAKLLQGYVSNLLPEIVESVSTEIEKKNIKELENMFTPWLAQEVANEVGQMIDSRDLLQKLVKEIIEERADAYLELVENDSEMFSSISPTNQTSEVPMSTEVENVAAERDPL